MRLLGLLGVAAALAVAAPAPATPNPLYRNSVGAGAVTGNPRCGMATATGTVFNTVITGYVGTMTMQGTCDAAGNVELDITGDAVTGSTLRCFDLVGTSSTDGVRTTIEVTGVCEINNFPTNVRWHLETVVSAGAFTVVLA